LSFHERKTSCKSHGGLLGQSWKLIARIRKERKRENQRKRQTKRDRQKEREQQVRRELVKKEGIQEDYTNNSTDDDSFEMI
jgi:hypothetical protein